MGGNPEATFVVFLQSLTPAALVEFLSSLPRPALSVIHDRWGLVDLECHCHDLPCKHQRTPDPDPLPDWAKTWLLWKLWPDEYTEPPVPTGPSRVLLPQAKVEVMRARVQEKFAIWHPDDLYRRRQPWETEPDEFLHADRQASRLRNGAVVAGAITEREAA